MSIETNAVEAIASYVEELERRVAEARSLPLSSSALLPRDELFVLIDELRGALPAVLRQASTIVGDREQLIGEARQEASRIIREGHESAVRLAALTEVVAAAWAHAGEDRRETDLLLAAQRRELLGWADVALEQMEELITGSSAGVRQARSILADPARHAPRDEEQKALTGEGGASV